MGLGGEGASAPWTLLSFKGLRHLHQALATAPSLPATQAVVLLCSEQHTRQVFSFVSRHKLERADLWWLGVSELDAARRLQPLLREGTQVTLAVPETDSAHWLLVARVGADDVVRLVPAGRLHLSGNVTRVRLTTLVVPDVLQQYSDFGGRELVVAALNNWPYFVIKTLQDGRRVADSGIDVQILTTLANYLNFTHRVLSPSDDQWGAVHRNGTVTGLVGLVARREAHIAICEITITRSRETVLDFTNPYFLEYVTLVSRAPALKNRTFAVFSPFSLQVWLCVALITVLMGPVASVVARVRVSCERDAQQCSSTLDYSFSVFRNLVVQGNLIPVIHLPSRCIFIFWYLFCFYVYALYSGTLTAVLAVPAYEKPIDGLTDIPEAISQGFTLGVMPDSSLQYIFKEAEGGIYKKVWNLFDHGDPSRSFVKHPDLGFRKVTQEKFVFVNPQLNSELRASQRGRQNFHIARQAFFPQAYGIACISGAPFLAKFNQILGRLVESGMVQHWKQQEVVLAAAAAPNNFDAKKRASAISLKHLQAAFLVLLLGAVLGGPVLTGEFLAARCFSRAASGGNN
ncbi:glutamate receptor ionotropic, delta-2-like isoform X2 [Scylla paramamosain]|uniref:glutamate receptor ionotropic, delta-2-like isoform X2 n=1 Tax=Scylla paramamosain TaxID=85552 RepID=UPI003082B8C8